MAFGDYKHFVPTGLCEITLKSKRFVLPSQSIPTPAAPFQYHHVAPIRRLHYINETFHVL
ncbi:MAG: hypothetical protein V7641_138 [Blastocatellia bacterium]